MIPRKIQTDKIEFLNTHIAGFGHHQGATVFDQLKIGEELTMVLEPNNHYDHQAIALYRDDVKLGYIPRCENHNLWLLLRMDHADLFKVCITWIRPDSHPENQVGIIVYLLKNSKSTTFYDPGDDYENEEK